MPTQLEWQSKVERRVAAIAQFTTEPEPVRHMPLHISGWTERDQLLSDALHAFDVAQGLDKTLLTSVEFESDTDDPAFKAHFKAERAWESHGALERAIDTWQRRNEPTLTSDANKTHDPSPAARRWVNGAACMEAIELEHAADVAITVEPIREELAAIDSLIEANEDAWVGDLLIERQELQLDLLAAMGGEKVPSLADKGRSGKRACRNAFLKPSGEGRVSEEFTVPTAERLRSYAVTFLAQRWGSMSLRFACEPQLRDDTGWTSKAVQAHVEGDLAGLAALNRTQRGLKRVARFDGSLVTVRPRVSTEGLTTRYVVKGTGKARRTVKVPGSPPVDQRDRALDRKLLVRAANRDLMPLQRPVHSHITTREPWEFALISRIRASFRMGAYKRGVYVPTSPRKTTGPQVRLVSPTQDVPRFATARQPAR